MTSKKWLSLVVLLYVLLGVTYALATPPLESSDEYKHYPVVQYIQNEHALPFLDPDDPGRWLQEAAQPPLYYIIMALLTSWIDTGDLPQVHVVNPHVFTGNTAQVCNKNLIVHDPSRESFPWQGTVLAIYLIRFASIGLGVATILLVARLGSDLFSDRAGLLAAALTAFNPMFLFVSAAVNNDSLSIVLAQAALVMLVRIWQGVPDPGKFWHRYAGLGVVIGLGVLAKLSLGGLMGLAGVALAWRAWQRRDWRILVLGGGVAAACCLIVCGWWFVYNWRIYGDPTALNVFVAVQGIRDVPIALQDWVGEFGTFYRSYWGLFGGVSIAAPEPFYLVCNLAALAGLGGLVVRLWKKQPAARGGAWLILVWIVLVFVLLLRWNVISPSFQGRLMFPALGAANVLMAVGFLAWSEPRRRSVPALLLVGWFFGSALLMPWTTIRPAYAQPDPETAIPAQALFGPVTFGGGEVRLAGVQVEPDQSTTPGGKPVKVILYWEAVRPVEADYVSSVHLLGRDAQSVGQVNRYPACGMVPTSRWQPGQVWRDEYLVTVARDATAPSKLLVSVGLFDPRAHRALPAWGPDNSPLEMIIVGQARLAEGPGEPQPEPPTPLVMNWADGISLAGVGWDPASQNLSLFWSATARPGQDYTVFVHLVDKSGNMIGQGDGPPVNGDYPTGLWEPGDGVVDVHHITPDGVSLPDTYGLEFGLYLPADGTRLEVWDSSGAPQPDHRVLLSFGSSQDE